MKLGNSRTGDSESGTKIGRGRISNYGLSTYLTISPKIHENRQRSRYRISEPGVRKELPELTQEVAQRSHERLRRDHWR